MRVLLFLPFLFLISCGVMSETDIQGKWTFTEGNSTITWEFNDGNYNMTGDTLLSQKGSYSPVENLKDFMFVHLEQEGISSDDQIGITISIDRGANTLMINEKGPFSKSTE